MNDVESGIPLKQGIESATYIKNHIHEFKALLGPHTNTNFESRWKKTIESSFLPRIRAEKKKKKNVAIARTIFSSSIIGINKYFIFENPEMDLHELSIIYGNTLKYALYDFNIYA